MKRLISYILIGIILGLTLVQVLTHFANQDFRFFYNALSVTDEWYNKLTEEKKPILILGGGSEIRNGLDPELMLRAENVYAINAATAAGFGVRVNSLIALSYARTGDTLLLSLHSGKNNLVKLTSGGAKLLVWHNLPYLLSSELTSLNWEIASLFLRSDASTYMVSFARFCAGYPTYRYNKSAIITPSGWMKINRYDIQSKPPYHAKNLTSISDWIPSPEAITYLKQLQNHCNNQGIHLILHLPIGYNTESVKPQRAILAYHLTQQGFNVLKDSRLGAEPRTQLFADTYDHLTPEGVLQNSLIISRLYKKREYWTCSELQHFLAQSGWTINGKPTSSFNETIRY